LRWNWFAWAGFLLSILAFVSYFTVLVRFPATRQLPASHGAPRVGQKAPDFTVRDTRGNLVSLSTLLSSSPETASSGAATQGVLLIFYRGYW
jgi:hypothetical protein